MFLIILVAVLVLGIAFFQVVQGLFSALIMVILTILCAAFAFTFYEPLAQEMLYARQPTCADAISLLALFLIPLLGLRILLDRVISQDVAFGTWPDRIGGGVLGLISAMVIVGVLTIAMQMLPFGETVFGYSSYDDTLKRDEPGLAPFYPDRFTIGLMDTLSRTSLGDGRAFKDSHPNLLLESFCSRNTGGTGATTFAAPDSAKILAVFAPTQEQVDRAQVELWDETPLNPLLDKNDLQRTIVLRVAVNEDTRDKSDGWWRLPATQFRLVDKGGQSHYPVGYLTAYERPAASQRRDSTFRTADRNRPATVVPWRIHTPPTSDENETLFAKLVVARKWLKTSSGQIVIDWVYRIGDDAKPGRLVFRRVCSQDIPKRDIQANWATRPASADDGLNRLPARRHRRR